MSDPAPSSPSTSAGSAPHSTSSSSQPGPGGHPTGTGKTNKLQISGFGMAVLGLDLLICLANGFALGWMIYKMYVVQDINYTTYSFFVNMGIAATGVVSVFGTLGNLLLLLGLRLGTRFAWYRIALGVASIGIALVLMFMVLPKPDRLMSESNQSVYIGFIGSSSVYLLWLIVYTVIAARAHWKRG